MESYEPTTDSWQAEASPTTSRGWPFAWVANGRIYVGGGSDGSLLNSIEVYDPATTQWTIAGNLPENKYAADAVVLNNKAYVVAGQTASGVWSNKVFAADLNASVSGVFDLYRKDGNASSGVPTVQAEVADGSVGPSKLSSEVSNALKPVVVGQPSSVVGVDDQTAVLKIDATGVNNSYQWKKDGVDITGATSHTLSIADLNASQHEGNYTVVVSNAFGAVTSSVAQIDVNGSLTEGLVGWWKFDETDGGVAYDSSGNGNEGNLTNGPTWVEGKIGGALSFDGVNNYVQIPNMQSFFSNAASFTSWVKVMSYNVPNEQGLAVFGVGQNLHYPYSGNSQLYINILRSINRVPNIQTTVNFSDWHHVSITTQNNGYWVMYHNSSQISRVDAEPLSLPNNKSFGRSVYDSSFRYLNGLLDDIRIYDRALSAVEVKALYELGEQPVQQGGSGSTTVVNGTVADGSITTNQLSEQILKYLKPEITQQPTASTIFADTNASLSVSAEGKYLTYQWKKNGTALAGETNATLSITDANSTQHDGNYTVVVSNDFGSVESGEADMDVWNVRDNVSNVSLWLDASNVGSFELSSSVIQNWRDLSGNGNDMNITIGNPSLTGQLNGLSVATYDGDDITKTSKNFETDLDQSGYSIVALSRYSGATKYRVISSTFGLRNWLLGHWGGKQAVFHPQGWVDNGITGGLDWHIYSVSHEPAISHNNNVAPLCSFWFDGALRVSDSGASSDTAAAPSDIAFGGYGLANQESSTCEVAEFIMVGGEISDSDRQKLEGNMAHKWGLSAILPNTHPYKN